MTGTKTRLLIEGCLNCVFRDLIRASINPEVRGARAKVGAAFGPAELLVSRSSLVAFPSFDRHLVSSLMSIIPYTYEALCRISVMTPAVIILGRRIDR